MMEIPNTSVAQSTLQQQVKNVDFVFKSLDEKALNKIKNSKHNLESIPLAIAFIQQLLQQFSKVMNSATGTSMEIVGIDHINEAYCNYVAARELLNHHMKNSNQEINMVYSNDLKQLDEILNENSWYFKTIKDYISKSTISSFQSNIESRFNSLLNGGNPIIQKSQIIENIESKPLTASSTNILITPLQTPVAPQPIPTRPRTLSPSPTDSISTGKVDPNSRLFDMYSVKTFIDVDTLMEIYQKFDQNVLLIDYRPSNLFRFDHISLFTNIVNIDPFSVKPYYTVQDILDHSLLLNSFKDKAVFSKLSSFDLIIIVDQTSIHAKISQDTLRFLAIIDEKNKEGNFKLKRKPVILDGGFDEWNFFMSNQASQMGRSPITINQNIPNLQNNYIHTKPIISRSPSPTGVMLHKNYYPYSESSTQIGHTSFPKVSPLKKLEQNSFAPLPESSFNLPYKVTPPSPVQINVQSVNPLKPPSPIKYSTLPISPESSINTPSRSPSPHKTELLISGLYNLGNSCYMNASLQCLIGTKELTNYLLKDNYQKFVAKDSKLGSHGRLTREYQSLAKQMLQNTLKRIATNPKEFKKVVGSVNSTFDNTRQQDSAEFLHFILDTIHEDLNWSANKGALPAISDEDEANRELLPIRLASTIEWERYLKTDYSSIIEIFAGQYASRLECGFCHKTSTTYIPFNMLSVPVPEVKKELNLYDCIDSFVSPEYLTGDNAWNCSRCHKRFNTKKQLTITRLPNVLIIHLERFTFKGGINGKFVKNDSKINLPLKLSMKKYWPAVRDEQERQQLKKFPLRGQEGQWEYNLYGIVRHYGTLDGGHYISEVKKNGTWIRFDDDKVKVSDTMGKKPEMDGSAYILFYEKVC